MPSCITRRRLLSGCLPSLATPLLPPAMTTMFTCTFMKGQRCNTILSMKHLTLMCTMQPLFLPADEPLVGAGFSTPLMTPPGYGSACGPPTQHEITWHITSIGDTPSMQVGHIMCSHVIYTCHMSIVLIRLYTVIDTSTHTVMLIATITYASTMSSKQGCTRHHNHTCSTPNRRCLQYHLGFWSPLLLHWQWQSTGPCIVWYLLTCLTLHHLYMSYAHICLYTVMTTSTYTVMLVASVTYASTLSPSQCCMLPGHTLHKHVAMGADLQIVKSLNIPCGNNIPRSPHVPIASPSCFTIVTSCLGINHWKWSSQ